ncbi:aminodeoxychorismate synthase component I [Shewanella waksmanii]|uniref:aminodeoxychorismate synthase component I n=1 Tax=Shewanella waksmanii TaxID=213783 RepID=UPI00048E74B1|nr:aminodeoxychorismate synthase component I [Shewanella waksmanii]
MASESHTAVFSDKLDWQHTTIDVFSHFADEPWAMLLDSADAKHPDSRHDIIVCDPLATVITTANQTDITHRQTVMTDNLAAPITNQLGSCPFTTLRTALDHYFPDNKTSMLPFSGGAMGAFSYDLGRHIERFDTIANNDINLAEMNIGLYAWALIYDNQQQQWHLVHYHGAKAFNRTREHIERRLQQACSHKTFNLTRPWQAQISQTEYRAKFERVQQYLHSGDCYQINLTQRFAAPYQGSEWLAYTKLRGCNAAPFSAFIKLAEQSVLSISPERFIQLQGSKIQTKPIKGTRPRFTDPQQDSAAANDLRNAEKDRAENLMIVDLLRNDIGKVAAPGSVAVPKLFDVESFPAVHHLVSTVTAQLADNIDASQLLRACFPGGSITGAPKIRAMQIIEELEPSRRSLYCGSIGYISQDGNMDTSITIRTLVADQGNLYCWAGGGIVADSDVDAEYQETYDKVSKILPILAADTAD